MRNGATDGPIMENKMSEHISYHRHNDAIHILVEDGDKVIDHSCIALINKSKRHDRPDWPEYGEYIVRACTMFADVEEGISLIARKDHYYQLEAQAKSQPALLSVCKDLLFLVGPQNTIGLSPKLITKAKAAMEKAGSTQ